MVSDEVGSAEIVERRGVGKFSILLLGVACVIMGVLYIVNVAITVPARPSWTGYHLFLGLLVLSIGLRLVSRDRSSGRMLLIADRIGAMAFGALAVGALLP